MSKSETNCSFMFLVANTPCSENLYEKIHRNISDPWPIKCIEIIEDDYGNEKEITDRTSTREEYAKFICALSWQQIDLSEYNNRNKAYNCLIYIGDHWFFQKRMLSHSMKAYEQNKKFFTMKQLEKLRKMIPSNIPDNDYGADDVDTDDEDDRNAPGICPSCQDEPPGNKYQNYECNDCACQTACAMDAYLSDRGL